MEHKHTILLVEDDNTLGYLLSEYLKMNAFTVSWAKTGSDALKEMQTKLFDLAILDIMLPDIDGFQLAEQIKLNNSKLPFIFLTARSLKIDVLKGFALGAVDYLKKPIDEEELVVRIKTLLNRIGDPNKSNEVSKELQIGDYVLNTQNQELLYKSEVKKLTNREAELLALLVTNKNQLCSYKEILISLWGRDDYFNKKSLNVFVSHLRKYLKNDPTITIVNVHSKGFILKLYT